MYKIVRNIQREQTPRQRGTAAQAGGRRLAHRPRPDMGRKGHFEKLATKQYPQDTLEDSSDTPGNGQPGLARRTRDGHNLFTKCYIATCHLNLHT